MNLETYLRLQFEEALGPENKWYASQYYNREITDNETLLRYYIKHGGAENFRKTHQLDITSERPIS